MRDHFFSFWVGKLGLPDLACGLENLEWREVKQKNSWNSRWSQSWANCFQSGNFTSQQQIGRKPSPKRSQRSPNSEFRTEAQNKLRVGSSNNLHSSLTASRFHPGYLETLESLRWTHYPQQHPLSTNWKPRDYHKDFSTSRPPLFTSSRNPTFFSLGPDQCAFGCNKNSGKSTFSLFWPGYKREVEVFVGSCLVCQKRNSPSKKLIHRLRA